MSSSFFNATPIPATTKPNYIIEIKIIRFWKCEGWANFVGFLETRDNITSNPGFKGYLWACSWSIELELPYAWFCMILSIGHWSKNQYKQERGYPAMIVALGTNLLAYQEQPKGYWQLWHTIWWQWCRWWYRGIDIRQAQYLAMTWNLKASLPTEHLRPSLFKIVPNLYPSPGFVMFQNCPQIVPLLPNIMMLQNWSQILLPRIYMFENFNWIVYLLAGIVMFENCTQPLPRPMMFQKCAQMPRAYRLVTF